MLRQVSAIALLLATQMAGGAVQLPFVAAVQAEETAIDIWRAFEMLDAESTQAEGLALVQQAAEAGNAPAMGRLGKITIHGDYGVPVDREGGIKMLEAAAAKGDSSAKIDLALTLLGTKGADYARAVRLLEEEASVGNSWAATSLAALYIEGQVVPADGKKALKLIQKSADAGDAAAMTVLGNLYARGAGSVAADPAKAEAAYAVAIDMGSTEAASRLGHLLLDQGGAANIAKGIELLEKSAASGNTWTRVELGDIYAAGKLLPADGAKAEAYYKTAFDAGMGYAATRLGDLYQHGAGTLPPDLGKAAAAYQQAADKGDNTARVHLALLLTSGSRPADPERALVLLQSAVDAGDAWAKTTLASYYVDGKVVPPDGEKALQLAEPLAAAGNTDAMLVLGDLYRNGAGNVAADPTKARGYYQQALESGNSRANGKLGHMVVAGEGGRQDVQRGLALLDAAADAGDNWELVLIGDIYAEGRYLPADAAKAAAYYRRSFDAGIVFVATRLGDIYAAGGPNLLADQTEAKRYYEAAVATGDATVKAKLGSMLIAGSDPEEAARGRDLLRQASDAGIGWASSALGEIYAEGSGVPPDYALAKAMFEAAGLAGDHGAELRFGVLIANGPLAAEHRADGVALIEAAFASGQPGAAAELARQQVAGQVEGKDANDALELLESAVATGDKSAVKYLLELYRFGVGSTLAPQQGKAKQLLAKQDGVFSPQELAMLSLEVETGEGTSGDTLARIGGHYADLAASDRRAALDHLFKQNQNGFTYVIQQELASRGLYSGRLNGIMSSATISAVFKACAAVNKVNECSAGPLTPGALAAVSSYLFGPAS